MNNSDNQPSDSQPSETQPVISGGSCGSHNSDCSASPQAEIAFVPVEQAPVIAPVTGELVSACSASSPIHPAEIATPVASFQTAEPSQLAEPILAAAPAISPAAAPAPVACEASAPALVTGTATAIAEQPVAPTLTDAAANDLAAALATAQRARSRAKSNSRGPRPSDLIEKKIVIRRDRWDALIQLTETLRSERAVKAEPSEVAAIVLEAGLGAIIEESRNKTAAAKAPVKTPTKAPTAIVARAPKAKVTPAKTGLHRGLKSKLRGKAKAKAAPRPTRAAPAKPRAFKQDELDVIKRLVRGLNSDRSVQRTLALWLGAHPVKGGLAVPIEDLRLLCREFKVYDTANFAQNMKKDAAYFTEVRDRSGDRLGYSLTPAGAQACSGLFAGSK